MEHELELIIARLEILEIEVCNISYKPRDIGNLSFSTSSYPGNIGNLSFSTSHILEILDRTIHMSILYVDVAGRRGPRGVRGGRGGTATAAAAAAATAAASQQLSNLARALDHHAQGPNIPFGVNPSLRYSMYMWIFRNQASKI